MRSLLLAVFLSALSVCQIRAENEHEFFARLIDTLPKAAPGEFKTPESVARCFLQAIIDNHIQDTFRCVPLSRMYAVDTFTNSVSYVGYAFSPMRETWPSDDYGRYLKLISSHVYVPVQKCRVRLLAESDISRSNLVQNVQQPESKDPVVVNQWLGKLSKDLSFQNLTNATIASVTSEPRKNADLKYLGVLPFKDIYLVKTHVLFNGMDLPVDFIVGLVDGNYQIHGVML